MEIWGTMVYPVIHKKTVFCIAVINYTFFYFIFGILINSILKQNKDELNIIISYECIVIQKIKENQVDRFFGIPVAPSLIKILTSSFFS